MELGKPTPEKEGPNENTYNIAAWFWNLIWFGYRIHEFGIFSYGLFITRMFRKDKIDTSAIVSVSVYSVIWVGWLLTMVAARFSDVGRVCSGVLLPDQMRDTVQPGYAVQQGGVILYMIYHTLAGIIVIAVLAGVAMFVCEMFIGAQIQEREEQKRKQK